MHTIRYHRLTDSQMGVLLECLAFPQALGNNLPCCIRMPVELDIERLKTAVEKMLDNHSNYRIRISLDNTTPCQYLSEEKIEVPIIHIHECEYEEWLHNFIQPFEIARSPLIRVVLAVTENYIYLVSDLHHLITDGITQYLSMREIAAIYDGNDIGKETSSFIDYADTETDDVEDSDREYYRELFEGVDISRLKADTKKTLGKIYTARKFIDCHTVDSFCDHYGTFTPANLFQAAFATTLSIWSRNHNVCYFSISAGRFDKKFKDTFGMFIKTFPVLSRIDKEMSVKDYLQGFKTQLVSVIRHRNYSFLKFYMDLGIMPETLFSFQGKGILEDFSIGGLKAEASQPHIGLQSVSNLSTVIYQSDDKYEIRVECSDSIHDSAFLETFCESIGNTLLSLMDNIDGQMKDVSIARKDNACLLKSDYLQTTSGQIDCDIVSRIDKNAEIYPDKAAVCAEDRTIRYKELKDATDSYARTLISAGKRPGEINCIDISRTCDTIISFIGTLKAGCTYVPVDPALPEERKDFIRKDCEVTDLSLKNTSGAYIIYTSGSSGRPKGVLISRKALNAFVAAISKVLEISSNDRISCHSSFAFDASVEDIYPVLCAGGTLYIVPEQLRKDPEGLCRYLEENRISGGNYSTRFGLLLLSNFDLNLRYLVLGGEKMGAYPKRNRHIKLFNTYGPTEFTVDATSYEMNPAKDYPDIPIGRPIPGVQAFVLDTNLHPVPPGVPGELCLAGAQIADGYWNLPDKTKEAFINLPEWPDLRLYRTGDIVRTDSNGLMYYVGRNDGQIKLKGFRIELKEIEKAALQVTGVSQIALKVDDNNARLCCFYVGEGLSEDCLREELKNVLPYYMVPDIIMRVSDIPLTMNGKTDFSKLPSVSEREAQHQDLPIGEKEQAFFEAVAEILGHRNFSVTDDLHSLGLTSLDIMTLSVRLSRFGIKLSAETVLHNSCIRDIVISESQSCFRYDGSRKGLPVALLICGVTGMYSLISLCKKLSESYDLYVIEPINEHMDGLESIEDIIEYYSKLVEEYVSMPISAVFGHSFGGELALLLAQRLSQSQNAPSLTLFDTSIVLPKVPKIGDIKQKVLADYLRLSAPAYKYHRKDSFRPYPGPCRMYYSANRKKNATSVQNSIPGLQLIKVDANHFEMLQEEHLQKYL